MRRARQVAVGVVEQVGRAAERGAHAREALGRRAGGERLAGGRAGGRVVGVQAAEPQQRRAQRERDLDEPRLGGARVGEHAERLAHLDRVAGRAAEHLVHVGEQRLAGQPVAARDGDDRARQLGALLARSGMNAPEPALTSITSASSPAASFFDRIEATISGIDSTVAVASRSA